MAPNFRALFKALVWEHIGICTQGSNQEEDQKGKPYGMFNFDCVPNTPPPARKSMNQSKKTIDKDLMKNLEPMELMLTHALASGNSALWHWETGGEKIYLSASYYLMLGYHPFESGTDHPGLIDHIHPGDKSKTEQKLTRALSKEQDVVNLEFRAISKAGQPIWLSCMGRFLSSDGQKRERALLGVICNISDYKTVRNILAENERYLETLMNHLPGMVYKNKMVDDQWQSEFVSKGIRSLLGYTKHYFMSNKEAIYADSIDDEDRSRIWETINKSIKKKCPYELVYRIKAASGQYKWVWDKGEVFLAKNGKPLTMEGFMMDITLFKDEEIKLQTSLKSATQERYRFGDIIGKSPEMKKIYGLISAAAMSDATVIIYGESGTGKELVAREIHKTSQRNTQPLIIVNCGAIPEKLLESEFFGYEKGAFTGAHARKDGLLAAAEGGTLFLDEIGEISLEFQVKLLRLLDGHGYTPVGSNSNKKANVRIIAATNRNLEELVQSGRMRQDFYYRIHIIPITLPALRNKRNDIPLLIDHFLEKYAQKDSIIQLPGRLREAFDVYDWPGNIRQLENVIQRYAVMGETEGFDANSLGIPECPTLLDLEPSLQSRNEGLKSAMEKVEKNLLIQALQKNKWKKEKTANSLKITRRTLHRKLTYYGIK